MKIKNLNVLDKEFIIIPYLTSDGIWNSAIIENVSKIIKSVMLKKYKINNKHEPGLKAKLTLFIFDKLQSSNKDTFRKLLEYFENFLKFYIKLKYNTDDYFFMDQKGVTMNNFVLNFIKLKTFKVVEDTGLIILKIIQEISSDENSSKFMDSCVRIYCQNNFRILTNMQLKELV